MYIKILQRALLSAGLLFSARAVAALFSPLDGLDLAPGTTYRYAFVTNGVTSPTSTGIGVYNTFVNAQANLPGSEFEGGGIIWYAIASTRTVSAATNIGTFTDPVYLVTGVPVADGGSADLWDGSLDNPLNLTQFSTNPTPVAVGTGTASDGSSDSRSLGRPLVRVGDSGRLDTGWISAASASNKIDVRLYAISEQLIVPVTAAEVPIPPTVTLLAFGMFAFAGRRIVHRPMAGPTTGQPQRTRQMP